MATLSTFTPFDQTKETWDSFLDRFACFLSANDYKGLPGDRKLAVFLSVCGHDMFENARALLAPQSVQDVAWETLLAVLKGHYAPLPSRVARRHAFRFRYQKEGETIAQYTAALRQAALYCEFKELEEILLDQLICGVRDIRLQRRLLARTDITLQTAIDEARASELSNQSATEIRKPFNSATTDKPSAVHQEEVELDQASEGEWEISRLKASQTKNNREPEGKKTQGPCGGCGGNHNRSACRFKNVDCRRCGKKGHLARVCRAILPVNGNPARPNTRGYRPQNRMEQVEEDCFTIVRSWPEEIVDQASSSLKKKLFLSVLIEGKICKMEIDTGSSVSIISWDTLRRLVPSIVKSRLLSCRLRLRDYQGNHIPILGCGRFRVQYRNFSGRLKLVVVNGSLPSLLGLEWFEALGLAVTGIHGTTPDPFSDLVTEFADVFNDKLGKYTGTPISFNMDPSIAPRRLKPRRVPFALRPKVDKEIDKLIEQGILEPVEQARWETPIVIPIKSDGSIRICADYKATINRALQANPYPVPVVQHLLHSLGRGSIFAKLDMAQAYQQLEVDDATAEAQTIVTHRGAFKCRRLQFGVCVAPGIFQSLMERLLHGLPGVIPYFDDIFVSAMSEAELVNRLRIVLSRFRQKGLKLKLHKCKLGVRQVEFLGFLVDANGLHPSPSKVRAIKEAPTPKNKTELQAFLGILNFYNIFLPHKSTVAEPLHRLLRSHMPWAWGQKEARAFHAVKDLLLSTQVLVQYDANLPLTLACDASPYGVGAVLSHRLPNGSEAPIAYFSRTLSSTERNYGHIDKEALAAVAGVKRFHDYLYGRSFDLITDHKPLLGILASDRQTPSILSPRMTRWVVFLAAYKYRLVHRAGKAMGHADALSRCPLPVEVEDPAPASSVLLIDDRLAAVTAADVARLTSRDSTLRQICDWVKRGWPQGKLEPEFQHYGLKQHEISILRGCLLWGSRVIIPKELQEVVLHTLHEGHPGIARMKALARSYVWWPKLDEAIADWVASCQRCQENMAAPPTAAVREWETPRAPWSRIHLDFAGPFQGHTFMVVVDAYSKWVEVASMTSTTAEVVVKTLRKVFATHGLPDVLVSDNGPQLTSAHFQTFLARHGIRHALSAPFHPASNGLAERTVRSAKEVLVKLGPGDWHTKLATYLLSQHSTPNPITNRSPAELLMGRRLRTTLDRLHPDYSTEKPPDSMGGARIFQSGEWIYALNFGGDPRWLPGQVVEVTGPHSYRVQLDDGRIWRRHIDQIRKRRLPSVGETPNEIATPLTPVMVGNEEEVEDIPSTGGSSSTSEATDLPPCQGQQAVSEFPAVAADPPPAVTETPLKGPPSQIENAAPRRSGRSRHRPAYLADYACAIQEGRSAMDSRRPCDMGRTADWSAGKAANWRDTVAR